MINLTDTVCYGTLVKVHGLQGELVLESKIIDDTKSETMELVFLIIDGKPVPFFLEQIIPRNNSTYLIGFDTVHTPEKAKELVGVEVFGSTKFVVNDSEKSVYQYLNFMVIDQYGKDIGTIEELIDLNNNLLFKLMYNNEELLLPAHPDLILASNKRKKTINLNIPEGLI